MRHEQDDQVAPFGLGIGPFAALGTLVGFCAAYGVIALVEWLAAHG